MTELEQLHALIQLERQEEMRRYEDLLKNTSIAQRRDNGVTWYPVAVSNEEIGIGGQLLIDIEPTVAQNAMHLFQTGQTAALFSNAYIDDRPILQGVIARVEKKLLRLAVNVDELPDWVSDGKLGVDLLYNETTFREMESAVKKLIAAKAGTRIAELRDILLAKRPADFRRIENAMVLPQLNDSQNAAFNQVAHAYDLAIIHGPPGTGKTTTLIETIKHAIKHETQVLVCAPSNAATDLLAQKLAASGLRVLRVGHTARLDENLIPYSLDAQIAQHPETKNLKKLYKYAHELRSKAQKYRRSFGGAERQERQSLLDESRSTLDYAKSIEKHILNTVVGNAQAICCTLVAAAQQLISGRQFRTVFIDEAAQALEAATWIPILLANRVVLAGDHYQLPPTVKSLEAQRAGLGLSLFEKCIARQPQVATMLDVQYRMNEQIMQFPSREFYHNQLKADISVATRTLALSDNDDLMLQLPVTFIDTAGCGFSEELNTQTLSLSNPQEADLLLRYLNLLYQCLELSQPEKVGSISLGIIAPYKEQTAYLSENLPLYENMSAYLGQISVNTVDGFQGQERDIIAISLTRSNEDGVVGFLADTRRMNVAITRAKCKLIIIGDSATIAGHPFYRDFLDYIEQIGAYTSAWELIE
jgi:ATP-dependent RNA/DNA helicase IGHMBP2